MCLVKLKRATIIIRTEEPDFSSTPTVPCDWEKSVYGKFKELVPHDSPAPLGKYVVTVNYNDSNFHNDVITGRSITGVMHVLNKTPVDWYINKKSAVETDAHGSENSSVLTCAKQILNLRIALRHLGAPLRKVRHVFGENYSVLHSSMTPHG